MHTFDKGSAMVIAEDIRSTIGAVDDALVNGARLLGALVETARASQLNAIESQRLYDSAAAGLTNVVKGRNDMVDLVKRVNVLKRDSNLETVDIGCDNPLKPTFTGAELPAAAQPVAAL